MTPVSTIEGKAIPFGRANVDTDVIIPAKWLKTISRKGLGRGAFETVRAEPGEQAAALRATLAGYFANGENVMRTADALGLHRNTVRARISRCLDGRAEPYDSIEIALALRLFDAFPIDQLTVRASSQQPQL